MALAHIRNGAVIKRFSSERGWLTLEDGRYVSPPVEGFVDGNDRVVPVVEETVDNSTGPDVVRSRTETVEADRVLRTTTIRDMTAQELDDRLTAEANIQRVLLKVITNHENRIRTLESRPQVTEAQVRDYLKGLLQ